MCARHSTLSCCCRCHHKEPGASAFPKSSRGFVVQRLYNAVFQNGAPSAFGAYNMLRSSTFLICCKSAIKQHCCTNDRPVVLYKSGGNYLLVTPPPYACDPVDLYTLVVVFFCSFLQKFHKFITKQKRTIILCGKVIQRIEFVRVIKIYYHFVFKPCFYNLA